MTQSIIEKLEALPTELHGEGAFIEQYVKLEDLRAIIEQDKRESACQYGKDVGMPQYSCAVKCQYEQPSHTQLISELVKALELSREKLQIECGGNREYKGGMPTQALFPMIDALLAKAKEMMG